MTSAVPSVAMNALTRSLVTIRPLIAPIRAPMPSTSAMAGRTLPDWPSIVEAPTSEARLITCATDRSSEPSRMTQV
jgi:hypothetical protein